MEVYYQPIKASSLPQDRSCFANQIAKRLIVDRLVLLTPGSLLILCLVSLASESRLDHVGQYTPLH